MTRDEIKKGAARRIYEYVTSGKPVTDRPLMLEIESEIAAVYDVGYAAGQKEPTW